MNKKKTKKNKDEKTARRKEEKNGI
jgi:hypothetical protein